MKQSAQVIATLIRLVACGFWVVAGLTVVTILTRPIARIICDYGYESLDPRFISNAGVCLVAGGLLFLASRRIGVLLSPDHDDTASYIIAFAALRLFSLLTTVFACVWISLGLIDIVIYTLSHVPGNLPAPIDNARFECRRLFDNSLPFLLCAIIWFVAPRIARRISK